jgi:protein-S-isoprenylcysteine O-methyltransferase Ste14
MGSALIICPWRQTFGACDIVINAVLTVSIIIGTRPEEKKPVREFGDTYIKYQHEAAMLVPFIGSGGDRPAFIRRKETSTATGVQYAVE